MNYIYFFSFYPEIILHHIGIGNINYFSDIALLIFVRMENKQKTQINMIPIDFTLFNPAIMEIKLHSYSCFDQQVLNNQTELKIYKNY